MPVIRSWRITDFVQGTRGSSPCRLQKVKKEAAGDTDDGVIFICSKKRAPLVAQVEIHRVKTKNEATGKIKNV